MSKKPIVILIVVMALMVTVGIVAAQQLPGSGWLSGQQIQNIGSGTATISFTAYNSTGGSINCGAAQTAVPFAGVNVSTKACDVTGPFTGSAVVSSDQPIAAVVNVANNPTGAAGGMYRGTDGSQVDNVISFPLVKNNFNKRSTTLYLQNASASANTIVVKFTSRAGNSWEKTYPNVPANAMVVASPSDTAFTTNEFGSAVATGTGPLAGTALEHQTTAVIADNLAAYTGFTEASYDSVAYCPLVRHHHSGSLQTTGIDVQNVSTSAQKIKVTYTYRGNNGAGPVETKQVTSAVAVNPGQSFNFYAMDATYGMPAKSLGTAKVEGVSGGDVAVIVTDTSLGRTPRRITAYACFPANSATAKVAMPQYKEFFNGNTSGINVMNVGSSAATVTIKYAATNNGGPSATFQHTIAPGELYPFYGVSGGTATVISGNAGALEGTFGSAVITSTQPIVATQNESPDGRRPLQQDAKMYEGFNLVP